MIKDKQGIVRAKDYGSYEIVLLRREFDAKINTLEEKIAQLEQVVQQNEGLSG